MPSPEYSAIHDFFWEVGRDKDPFEAIKLIIVALGTLSVFSPLLLRYVYLPLQSKLEFREDVEKHLDELSD